MSLQPVRIERLGFTAEIIAFVTGANKGIGKEISRQPAAKGILVLMGARDRERGEQAVADLRSEGLPAEFIQIRSRLPAIYAFNERCVETPRTHGLGKPAFDCRRNIPLIIVQ
jgi:NAD(P)-dependent dehydrogenase (short-subunit alcohol dehydrogenase family)